MHIINIGAENFCVLTLLQDLARPPIIISVAFKNYRESTETENKTKMKNYKCYL